MSIKYNLGGRPPQSLQTQQSALFEQALRLHQQGQLAQANQIYNAILQANSRHFGALHMLGVLAYQTGHHQAACDLMAQAIAQQPKDPAPHVNRGLALGALGLREEALAHFDRAIALRADFAEAHVNRGKTLVELGRVPEALQSYDLAIATQPRMAAAHNNKGTALRTLERLDEALECYQRACALDGNYVDALLNMATLHAALGQADEALAGFDQLLALQPQHAQAHNGKGAILAQKEQWALAVPHFQAAIQSDEKLVSAHKNLGQALHALAQYAQAVPVLRKAAELQPDDLDILALLAVAQTDAGQFADALGTYDLVIWMAPDRPGLYFNRAGLHVRFNRHAQALADFMAASDMQPDNQHLFGWIANSRVHACDWSGLSADLKRCEESIRAGENNVPPFVALSLFDAPALQMQAAINRVAADFPENHSLGAISQRAPSQKIRVGYYSADFYGHATAFLMAELFEKHDRQRFEWFAFSYGPNVQDSMRERLAASFDHFIDVREHRDIDVARMSRELGIDIAVDLKGFTTDQRFGIFSHRCAPVQVSYLGYPGTTGAPYMDYVVADRVVIPEKEREFFTEKVVYLPHSYQVNDAKRRISDRVFTREELGLPSSGFVFCCFNNNYKIRPPVFDSWMRILQAVPGSVLWLFEGNASVMDNLRAEAQSRGIAGDRLVFAPRMPLDDHLARHRLADLFLDTLPYNAHTTASDALWAGLPVLTRAGQSFAARVAASLLQAVGMPELVTHTAEEYEALAIALAQDPVRLQALRDKLDAEKNQAPLFNAKQFASDIEAAYLAMHARCVQGLRPDHIEI
ncbi:tetratricopeptide repeat protein [Acidovorax sp. ACV02]|uniref:tetratricopeptide repeat protein n=1 Tax=Acidovorax sp. ACV02 TaxID=2769310 RepID=UPI0017810C22|nr:tetratricopeptide repeat protein [Acidovorax sp. ACV02]MBD9406158.1 tetratricopeptide repeat protein [Acidovorax sp. ACV02]